MKGFIILFAIFAFYTTFSQTTTLRDTTNQYDYIIITVPEFVSACIPFKEHKEAVKDFKTIIVDTTQIFAEFNSSDTPQDNIRDFISYAGTFWKEPQPRYILIAGSVQFVPNFNIPYIFGGSNPFHQSDFYYTQNIYENDSTTTDFYVGRIPARITQQLVNYFEKVIEYENNKSIQSWMNNSLFICEDDPQFDFLGGAMSIAENFPPYIRKYFIFETDTSIYYGNKDSIYSAINKRGNSLIWFEGHSRDSSFSSENYFNIEDLNGLSNASKYYILIFAATQRAIIDTNTNLSNEMLYLDNAGSIGALVVCGLSFWGIIKAYQRAWAKRFYDPNINSLGEAFDLTTLPFGIYYWYMKTVINLWADPSLKLKYDITTSVEEDNVIPTEFVLFQNYPNPFNPSTKIKFVIPKSSFVNLKVYNVLGIEAATLVNQERPAGNYEVEFNATDLPSGVYFYRLQAGDFIETKKMILLR